MTKELPRPENPYPKYAIDVHGSTIRPLMQDTRWLIFNEGQQSLIDAEWVKVPLAFLRCPEKEEDINCAICPAILKSGCIENIEEQR